MIEIGSVWVRIRSEWSSEWVNKYVVVIEIDIHGVTYRYLNEDNYQAAHIKSTVTLETFNSRFSLVGDV